MPDHSDYNTDLPDIIVWGYQPLPTGSGSGGGSGENLENNMARAAALDMLDQEYPERCAQKATHQNRIDRGHIRSREGGNYADGYPPPHTGSGVTIGVGVDLGVRNEGDLTRMHLDAATHEMLLPYLGRKDADAAAYLAAHPLHLNPAQLHELNTAVHNEILFKLHYNFDTQASAYPANLQFWRLPAAVQTVLVSVTVQYGPNLHLPASQGGTPAFFTLMKQGRWADAVHELRNFGDSFPTRRAQEANILQAAIDNGEIPASC